MAAKKGGEKVIFIYSKNKLFEKYLPQLKKELRYQGVEIKEQVFPTGTSKEKIRAWAKKNFEDLNQEHYMLIDKGFIKSISADEKFCSDFEKMPAMIKGRFKLIDKVVKDVETAHENSEYGRNTARILKEKAKEIYENEIKY